MACLSFHHRDVSIQSNYSLRTRFGDHSRNAHRRGCPRERISRICSSVCDSILFRPIPWTMVWFSINLTEMIGLRLTHGTAHTQKRPRASAKRLAHAHNSAISHLALHTCQTLSHHEPLIADLSHLAGCLRADTDNMPPALCPASAHNVVSGEAWSYSFPIAFSYLPVVLQRSMQSISTA